MLKVRAIVFRKKCRADLKKLGTSVRCTFRCNPRMSKTPTQHLYQIQLSFSCNGSEREVLVCEYIDSRWNLESSHYSLKTIRPNTVLKLVLRRRNNGVLPWLGRGVCWYCPLRTFLMTCLVESLYNMSTNVNPSKKPRAPLSHCQVRSAAVVVLAGGSGTLT